MRDWHRHIYEAYPELLDDLEHVEGWSFAGSIRRAEQQVGDLDMIVVTGTPAHAVLLDWYKYQEVFFALRRIEADTPNEPGYLNCDAFDPDAGVLYGCLLATSVRTKVKMDVQVVTPEAAGAALLWLTGSRSFGRAVQYARSPFGLYWFNSSGLHMERGTASKVVDTPTERSAWELLCPGLYFPSPSERTNRARWTLSREHVTEADGRPTQCYRWRLVKEYLEHLQVWDGEPQPFQDHDFDKD